MDIKFWPTVDNVVFTKQEISDLNIDAKTPQEVAERAVLHAYNSEKIELEGSPFKVVVKDTEVKQELVFAVHVKLQPVVSSIPIA